MSLMGNMNRALTATTGLQVRRAPKGAAPVQRVAAPKRRAVPEYRCTDDPGTDRLLSRPVDVRGAVCHVADRPLRVGQRVLVRHTTRTVRGVVTSLGGADELNANDLGSVVLRTADPLALDPYAEVRRTGAFLLVDPVDGVTLTAGMADLPS
jgi:hypothetical protein